MVIMQVENNDSWWDWLIGSCFSIFKNMQFSSGKAADYHLY
jgi:hypothetical protein